MCTYSGKSMYESPFILRVFDSHFQVAFFTTSYISSESLLNVEAMHKISMTLQFCYLSHLSFLRCFSVLLCFFFFFHLRNAWPTPPVTFLVLVKETMVNKIPSKHRLSSIYQLHTVFQNLFFRISHINTILQNFQLHTTTLWILLIFPIPSQIYDSSFINYYNYICKIFWVHLVLFILYVSSYNHFRLEIYNKTINWKRFIFSLFLKTSIACNPPSRVETFWGFHHPCLNVNW